MHIDGHAKLTVDQRAPMLFNHLGKLKPPIYQIAFSILFQTLCATVNEKLHFEWPFQRQDSMLLPMVFNRVLSLLKN